LGQRAVFVTVLRRIHIRRRIELARGVPARSWRRFEALRARTIDTLFAQATVDVELTLRQDFAAAYAEILLFDRSTETNARIDTGTLLVGLARRPTLASDTEATWLTFVRGAELFGAGVGNALERATILVIFAVRVLCASAEARVIRTRSARACDALLGIRAGALQAGDQTLAVDADARITAFEIELTAEGWRRRILFQRIEA
jgi:hypothetical protein